MNAREYHRITSYDRFAMQGHALDWAAQPSLDKRYPSAPAVSLGIPKESCGSALKDLVRPPAENRDRFFDKAALGAVLRAAYGHTAEKRGPGWRFKYRSAASAGALYPAEIYLVTGGLPGLPAGLFHYDVAGASLQHLYEGDPGRRFSDVLAGSADANAAHTFVITGIFFRSSWKYRKRAYRYVLMDAGHVVENLVLLLTAAGCTARVYYDFDDAAVAGLMGLDSRREVPLALIAAGDEGQQTGSEDAWLDGSEKRLRSVSISDREVHYPEIVAIHESGAPFSSGKMPPTLPVDVPSPWQSLPNTGRLDRKADFMRVLRLRRSRRNFTCRPWKEKSFWSVLDLAASAACRPAAGYPYPDAFVTGFLAGENTPLAPGFYLFQPAAKRFGRAAEGALNGLMADICLGQQWLAGASLQFVFMADFAALDRVYGPRGYRYAMLNAGRLGQLVYLAATEAGSGCCGIGAFFDTEAAQLLALKKGWSMLYLVAAGPVKKPIPAV